VEDFKRIAHPVLSEPPYSSARWFASGVMKEDRR
jgi:hypothetical protein